MVNPNECLFCKIAKGQIPSKKVYEDSDTFAFLDINPANKGHILVIPKQHYETIYDIEEDALQKLITTVKQMATIVNEKFKPEGINIFQRNGRHVGQLVDHVHFHIVPSYPDSKALIAMPQRKVTEKELDDVIRAIKEEKPMPKKDDFAKEEFAKDDFELDI